jgi:restriction endonuclease S subunit
MFADTPYALLGEIEGLLLRRGIPHTVMSPSGNAPVYSVRTLRDGEEPANFADLPTDAFGEEYLSQLGDVWVSLDNPGPRNVLFIDETMPRCTTPRQIITLRVQDLSVLNPTFLFAWVCSPAFQAELSRYANGLAMKRIAFDDLRRIAIPIPPVKEQQAMGTTIRELETVANIHDTVAKKITRLRELHLADLAGMFAVPLTTTQIPHGSVR